MLILVLIILAFIYSYLMFNSGWNGGRKEALEENEKVLEKIEYFQDLLERGNTEQGYLGRNLKEEYKEYFKEELK